ncbi:restriction endonuclease [Paraburkholderia sp. Ac-20340]|uniref:restriction endonuclease n=1 Tax=Paraburkholderia sp. Ac-20340 TaxID=2703888 RepID=UPI00198152A6|nr:restriction endonuclease [Paraburkholderia sp. Ac-20340]MBN3852803.1 restriction endonuclease [Paraburkholderia sp. Ac-20340]
MGGITFVPGTLADGLHETIGYKAGLAVSVPDLCDLLTGTEYPDVLRDSETEYVRLRSEEFQDLYYHALYKVGYSKELFNGDRLGMYVHKKYAGHETELTGVTKLMTEWQRQSLKDFESGAVKSMDPTSFFENALVQFGEIGLRIAFDRIEAMALGQDLDPLFGNRRRCEWLDRLDLAELKKRCDQAPKHGAFFDQRFINFLANNGEKISEMHWRRFEQMSAEFFHRAGFKVDIGTGGNDDGVDIRAWAEGEDTAEAPTIIVQCKRQKEKIDKVTVKGLATDIDYNGADYGVLITSTEFSVGAREVVEVRGYPIQEVNAGKVVEWLGLLREAGSGIVRV